MSFTQVTFEGGIATADTLARAIQELQTQLAGGTPGTGTVTSFGFSNANGFTGSVANGTTTPNLTLTAAFTLTTTGTSGAATYSGGTLNIPQYSGGGGTPGGSTTQVQYNNAGAFGGITGATTNGTALTLVAPVLGTPASGTLTNCTGLPLSTGVTGNLAVTNLNSGTSASSSTFWRGDGTWGTPPGITSLTVGTTTVTGGTTTRVLYDNAGVVGEYVISGTGSVAMTNSPTLITPALGTPSALVLTNATGLPLTTGIAGNLPVGNLNSGTAASSSTFWRGDGTWATPAGSGTVTHTAGALTANAIVVGNGSADITVLGSLGTTTTVLHGNAGGAPTFSAVDLANDVTGTLPQLLNAQTGTSYTIVSGDQGKIVTQSNASAVATTLPQATGSFTTGWSSTTLNLGAGTVTVSPTTSTINSASSVKLRTGQWMYEASDGTNYVALLGGQNANGLTSATTIVDTSAATAPSSGQVLTATAGTTATWQTPQSNVIMIPLSIGDPNSGTAISANAISPWLTIPFAATITGYALNGDAGTFTIKFVKIAAGTAVPTISNSINTSGVALSSGTSTGISSTLSDFTTTTVTAGDIVAAIATTVSGVHGLVAQLRMTKT